MIREAPPRLRRFVKALWIASSRPGAWREHVAPTGEMHLAFRLHGPEVKLYSDTADTSGAALGRAVVGGPRSCFYVKEAGSGACSAGVILRADAAIPLLDVPPYELVDRHAPLDDFWGRDAGQALECLVSQSTPEGVLDRLEILLSARFGWGANLPLNPVVATSLAAATAHGSVGSAVRHTGCSHRRFLELFRGTFGLAPKTYFRLQRFRNALDLLARGQIASLCDLALACGYSDQSHFNREFLRFTGVTPAHYRAIAPVHQNHIAVTAAR